MKKIAILLCFVSSSALSGGAADLIYSGGFESHFKRVFISGHSLVDNPYADYLASTAEGKGVDYAWNQQIGIGSPIRVRTSGVNLPDPDPINNDWSGYSNGKNRDTFDMDVIAELANPMTLGPNEVYDSLIITERHDIIDTIIFEYTTSLLHHYHKRLLAGNPLGQSHLYHSWWFMDFNNIQEWIDHETLVVKSWECVAEKVNLTLEHEGLPRAINNIPAGLALATLVQRILDDQVPGFSGTDTEKMDQLFNDNVHLNIEGVFFMSAVSYASLLGNTPEGIDIPIEIVDSTGQALLQIAWEVVSQYQASFTAPTMTECRNLHETQICSSYWNIHDQPSSIAFCQLWSTNNSFAYNPFNWPDPELIIWPDP